MIWIIRFPSLKECCKQKRAVKIPRKSHVRRQIWLKQGARRTKSDDEMLLERYTQARSRIVGAVEGHLRFIAGEKRLHFLYILKSKIMAVLTIEK